MWVYTLFYLNIILTLVFMAFTDPNWRNFTLIGGIPLAASLHILRRDKDAAPGCFVSVPGSLFLRLSQQSAARLLQVLAGA